MTCERCGGDSGAYRMHPDPHVCIARLEADRDRLAGELHELSQLHQVQGVELTCLEREVARLAAMLHPQPLPCGHAAEHGHTSDGGKTIRCCVCDRDRLAAVAAAWEVKTREAAELVARYDRDNGDLQTENVRLAGELAEALTDAKLVGQLTDSLGAEREAHAKTKAELATSLKQRDTAYGYGQDGGEPPWIK